MKKLTAGLAVLLSGYAANSFAALPTGAGSRCEVTVPSFCGGFTFGLTGLYWRVSSPELDFGVSFPNNTSFIIDTSDDFSARTFHGTHNHIKHDFNWAWSANIGYIFPCSGNDINLTYTHYDHDKKGDSRDFGFPSFLPLSIIDVAAPFIFEFPIDDLEVSGEGTFGGNAADFSGEFFSPANFDPVSFHLVIDPEDVTRVCARANFENNTWDLDFGQTINVGCNFRLRWFGGLRYTRLKHTLDVTTEALGSLVVFDEPIVFSGSFTVTANGSTTVRDGTGTAFFPDVDALVRDIVNQKSDFNGIGPRFGMTGDYHLGGGFGIIGSLSTSLLVGEVESRLRTRIDVTPVLPLAGEGTVDIVDVTNEQVTSLVASGDFDPEFIELCFNHPDETRVVPNIDAKIGLDWTYQFCNCSHSRLTIEAGYMVSHYFNAIDRLSVVEAIAPEFRTRHTVDVDFDGPYIGVQVAL